MAVDSLPWLHVSTRLPTSNYRRLTTPSTIVLLNRTSASFTFFPHMHHSTLSVPMKTISSLLSVYMCACALSIDVWKVHHCLGSSCFGVFTSAYGIKIGTIYMSLLTSSPGYIYTHGSLSLGGLPDKPREGPLQLNAEC